MKGSCLELTELAQHIAKLPAKRFLIAFSGGMDSMVLLHMFYLLKQQGLIHQPLVALHADHGLQKDSTAWEQFCADGCLVRQIPFISRLLSVKADQSGIEAAARKARYKFFEQYVQHGDYLCTAHHQDDQLETFLLRLARGSGLTGLTAIARLMPFADGYLYRPLLDYSRTQIASFAQVQHLVWIEDPSNQQVNFDRNYLRHQVIPLLKQRWPAIALSSLRTTDLLQQNQAVLDEYMMHLLQAMQNAFHGLDIDQLKQLSQATFRALLRFWLKQSGHSYPSHRRLLEIEKQMLNAKPDANPFMVYGDTEVRRYKNFIYAFTVKAMPEEHLSAQFLSEQSLLEPSLSGTHPSGGYLWQGEEVIVLSGARLSFTKTYGHGLSYDKVKSGIEIRQRQGGMKCKPVGRPTKTLKKWLQEYQVPPWLRHRIPLLYVNHQLVAVGDLFVCESWQAKTNEWGLTLHWQIR